MQRHTFVPPQRTNPQEGEFRATRSLFNTYPHGSNPVCIRFASDIHTLLVGIDTVDCDMLLSHCTDHKAGYTFC
jgi:hypothetical protein